MLSPGAHTLLQIVLRTGVIYFLVLIGIRLSGKREVGQMTPFQNNSPLAVTEAYVALTKSWTTSLASMPQAVIGPASAVHKGKLYCIGGANSGIFGQGVPYDKVQIYQP